MCCRPCATAQADPVAVCFLCNVPRVNWQSHKRYAISAQTGLIKSNSLLIDMLGCEVKQAGHQG